MRASTAERLLESIASERLVVFCGAGLSMGPPSSLPSAAAVARQCAAHYEEQIGSALPPNLIQDVERMALHFKERNQLESLFIEKLIPWDTMINAAPNTGHEAIADFLGCGVVQAGVTTNYDCLVEDAAAQLGEQDFLAIISQEDLARATPHRPYLKVHGCLRVGHLRHYTVWCRSQVDNEPLATRMALFRTWLQSNLLDRDILIVGFWSDWAYLSEILASTINAIKPRTIYLVDPSPPEDLMAKAPLMWKWANATGVQFHHEQESGAEFLAELRRRYSQAFLTRALNDAKATYQALFAAEPQPQADFHGVSTGAELYALRRDLTGTPPSKIVREKNPRQEFRAHVAVHQRLMDLGARYQGHTYELSGEVLRLIASPGQMLSEVRRKYSSEPPTQQTAHRIVCVGAIDDPTPSDLVRPDEQPSILRGGVPGTWCTDEQLRGELRA